MYINSLYNSSNCAIIFAYESCTLIHPCSPLMGSRKLKRANEIDTQRGSPWVPWVPAADQHPGGIDLVELLLLLDLYIYIYIDQ